LRELKRLEAESAALYQKCRDLSSLCTSHPSVLEAGVATMKERLLVIGARMDELRKMTADD